MTIAEYRDRCNKYNGNPTEAVELIAFGANLADSLIKAKEKVNKADTVPYSKVAGKYNEICTSYSSIRVKALSSQRQRHIKACFNKGITLEMFEQAFISMEQSEFIRSGTKTWANFDWIIQYNNLSKVLDGNYNNQAKEDKLQNSHSYDLNAIMEHAMYSTPEVRA